MNKNKKLWFIFATILFTIILTIEAFAGEINFTEPEAYHTYEVISICDNVIQYKCKTCGNIKTCSATEIYNMWETKDLNKPISQATSEKLFLLDVVQDGVINAKDYAKLKQESKHS